MDVSSEKKEKVFISKTINMVFIKHNEIETLIDKMFSISRFITFCLLPFIKDYSC